MSCFFTGSTNYEYPVEGYQLQSSESILLYNIYNALSSSPYSSGSTEITGITVNVFNEFTGICENNIVNNFTGLTENTLVITGCSLNNLSVYITSDGYTLTANPLGGQAPYSYQWYNDYISTSVDMGGGQFSGSTNTSTVEVDSEAAGMVHARVRVTDNENRIADGYYLFFVGGVA